MPVNDGNGTLSNMHGSNYDILILAEIAYAPLKIYISS